MTTFTIDDLFTPAASGITPGNPSAVPPSGTWLAQLLANAQTLELDTTAWQPGGMMRTVLALMATILAQEDALVSLMAQGGFLDFSASGSVTYVAADGTTIVLPVSPDPSVAGQNPDGNPTWLDILSDGSYNVQRDGAQQASGILAIANTTGNTYGPFSTGTYHVENPTTGAGYTNQSALTIAPQSLVGSGIAGATNLAPIQITTNAAHGLSTGAIVYISGVLGNTAANGFWRISVVDSTNFVLNGSTGSGSYTSGGTVNVCTTATFAADLKGPSGTSTPGGISSPVTTLTGVLVKNLDAFFGRNFESNLSLAKRDRLKLQSISPGGPKGAYEFFALSAAQLLGAQTPSVQLSSAINRVLVQTSTTTGVVTVNVASAAGAVPGVSNLDVTDATNATPIVITTGSAHGLSSGDYASISGVEGNSNANGTWSITVLSSTTFALDGSIGNAAYTTGGTVEGGDLGQVDRIIQANCVPDDVTAITRSATVFNVAIVATVFVPLGRVATYQAAVQTALVNYFAGLPIGGLDGTGNQIIYDDIVGVLYQAGSIAGQPSYVIDINATVNGVTTDVPYSAPTSVAVLSPAPSITVVGR